VPPTRSEPDPSLGGPGGSPRGRSLLALQVCQTASQPKPGRRRILRKRPPPSGKWPCLYPGNPPVIRCLTKPPMPFAVLSTLAFASRDGIVAYQRPAHNITIIAAEKTQSIHLVGQDRKNLEVSRGEGAGAEGTVLVPVGTGLGGVNPRPQGPGRNTGNYLPGRQAPRRIRRCWRAATSSRWGEMPSSAAIAAATPQAWPVM